MVNAKEKTSRFYKKETRKKRVMALSTILFVLFTLIVTLTFSTPHRLIESGLGKDIKGYFSAAVPQGWGFFTRDPRDEAVRLYLQDEQGDWGHGYRGYSTSFSSSFGWNRDHRVAEYDIQKFLNNPSLSWADCTDVTSCLQQKEHVIYLEDSTELHPKLRDFCAAVLIARTPTPFAYSGLDHQRDYHVQHYEWGCSK